MITSGTRKNRHLTVLGSLASFLFSLSCHFIPSASAAERITVQIGPLQQSVNVNDLEQFVKTGELSPQLQTYRFLLTPEIRQILSKTFSVDPILAEQFVDDILSSLEGQKLLSQLNEIFPGSTSLEIKSAFHLLLQQTSQLNIINFLRVYPSDNINIDLSSAASIAIQLNTSHLQSKLLTPRLEKALKVETNPSFSLNFDPTKQGEKVVSIETLILNDHNRNRRIPIDIYYSQNTQGPLIVMSHGFAADRKFLQYLAYHLASYGFTVVSIEHPGSNINALVEGSIRMKLSKILPASEFIDRPQDVSFVLDKLTEINQLNNHLQGKFNTQKVTMIGHSFGGYTALALAGAELNLKELRSFCQELSLLGRSPADWLQCAPAELPYSSKQFKDPRIVQVIALNPIIGNLFGKDLSKVNIPTLILSSSEDGITPIIPHQLQPFQQLKSEKYLLVALGATHMSVTDMSNLDSAVGQNTLVREVMGKEANSLRQLMKGISLAFIEQLTPDAQKYQAILTPNYVQSLSNSQMMFRLTKDLSISLDAWLNVLDFSPSNIAFKASHDQESWFSKFEAYFVNAKNILPQPEYSTQKLDYLFTILLNNYHKS